MNMSLKFDPSKKIHEQITEETWCKGTFAVDANGVEVGLRESGACRACALGWIILSNCTANSSDKLREVIGTYCVGDWNDASTFAEVQAAFKAADL